MPRVIGVIQNSPRNVVTKLPGEENDVMIQSTNRNGKNIARILREKPTSGNLGIFATNFATGIITFGALLAILLFSFVTTLGNAQKENGGFPPMVNQKMVTDTGETWNGVFHHSGDQTQSLDGDFDGIMSGLIATIAPDIKTTIGVQHI